MTKYQRLMEELQKTGFGTMKCFGNSMLPILSNPSTCLYKVKEEYDIDDIVFCKVKGRYIDAHKITAKTKKGNKTQYLISNNHNYDNGWTSQIYAKVVEATDNQGNKKTFK